MKMRWSPFKARVKNLVGTVGFKNLLLFLVFVLIACIFWFIMALNDSVQNTFTVKLHIYDVPDSVTFITDPPAEVHVNVRDKGTSMFRLGVINKPEININFKEFANRGVFRYTSADLYADLRQTFGSAAQISNVSIDSLHLTYTTSPGKRVPIVIASEIVPGSGSVIAGRLKATPKDVLVYSDLDMLDTLTRVYTDRIVKRGIKETTEVEIKLKAIPHAKFKPDRIKVTIPVEALVSKTSLVNIRVENLPPSTSVLLFPAAVNVTFYAPMSKFNDVSVPITLAVDFHDIAKATSGKLPVRIVDYDRSLVHPTLQQDSVEFTVVR